jgi:hypothetical protein
MVDWWDSYFHSVSFEVKGSTDERRDKDKSSSDIVVNYIFYPKRGYTLYKTAFTTLNGIFESVGGIYASICALAVMYVSGHSEDFFKKTIADNCRDQDLSKSELDDDTIEDDLKTKVSWSGLYTLANENVRNKARISQLEMEIAALKKE